MTGRPARPDRCDVEGCGKGRIHAGDHGPAYRPTTTSCAPLRCYCGACPSWRPRVPPPPPRLDVEATVQLAAAARAAVREASGVDAVTARARDLRRREARRRAGLTVAGGARLTAA